MLCIWSSVCGLFVLLSPSNWTVRVIEKNVCCTLASCRSIYLLLSSYLVDRYIVAMAMPPSPSLRISSKHLHTVHYNIWREGKWCYVAISAKVWSQLLYLLTLYVYLFTYTHLPAETYNSSMARSILLKTRLRERIKHCWRALTCVMGTGIAWRRHRRQRIWWGCGALRESAHQLAKHGLFRGCGPRLRHCSERGRRRRRAVTLELNWRRRWTHAPYSLNRTVR